MTRSVSTRPLHVAAMRDPARSAEGPTGLPVEQPAKARRRVGAIGATGAVAALTGLAASSVIWTDATRPVGVRAAACIACVYALAMWAGSRHPRVSDRLLLRAALVGHVLTCWVIQLTAAIGLTMARGSFPELTLTAVLMVAYPLVVPAHPKDALWAAVLAALAIPASSVAVEQILHVDVPGGLVVWASLLGGFAASMAWVGTRSFHELGTEVVQARRLGAYELIERLGQGGMGEVWRARHQMLVRDAAVKLILPERIASGDTQTAELVTQRFAREAKATAALESPHTVRVYDFGRSPDGAFYYVMELLDGVDLNALVRREGPQPPERVVHVLIQACHSLAEAHRRGMVHRDIKPANLILCRDLGGDHDVVKVLDFGIVALSRVDAVDPALTGQGHLTGTLAFMSPEALDGREKLDGRADLYALGCVAFWLLTGERLFGGGSAAGIIAGHLAQTPPARSTVAATSPALDAVVLACLAKDRAQRPGTAEALARLLVDAVPHRWQREDAERRWVAAPTGPGDGLEPTESIHVGRAEQIG